MKKLVLLCVVLISSLAAIADDSGSCGDKLTWTYSEATKTLTITGTGTMNSYDNSSSYTPWYAYRNKIEKE